MPLYPVVAEKASCRVRGCACRDRERRYPSDLTDQQWQLVEPEARAVMAELRTSPGGAPMRHDLRAMLDAIGHLTRYGLEWQALPVDFPPRPAVYAFFERWSERGLPHRLADRLRGRIRIACGRAELPTAAVIDAQTVLRLTVTIVKRTTDKTPGFVVLPRRWVVETTFGWLTRHRRLVRDYERKPEHHEAMVWCGGPPSPS